MLGERQFNGSNNLTLVIWQGIREVEKGDTQSPQSTQRHINWSVTVPAEGPSGTSNTHVPCGASLFLRLGLTVGNWEWLFLFSRGKTTLTFHLWLETRLYYIIKSPKVQQWWLAHWGSEGVGNWGMGIQACQKELDGQAVCPRPSCTGQGGLSSTGNTWPGYLLHLSMLMLCIKSWNLIFFSLLIKQNDCSTKTNSFGKFWLMGSMSWRPGKMLWRSKRTHYKWIEFYNMIIGLVKHRTSAKFW